ncbi:MAG: O-6-methylguanine DNA methyltransferase [uncultured bacterium]|nr:MAG: O-6-methylguanine DNA methyltransferase [uncultured bacterium]
MKKSKNVYKIVLEIPKGKVMTYGQIGKTLGINPRQVGKTLHENPDPDNIPCHRVVNLQGEVADKYAFGGGEVQVHKLAQEGVGFVDGKVDLEKYIMPDKNLS